MKIAVTKLDKLFSSYIRLRAKGKCEVCQSVTNKLQTCHFHGRRKRSVRWHEDNAIAGCFGCHRFLDENPVEKVEFFLKRLGKQRFDRLNMQAQQIYKVDEEATALYLNQKLKELEG